MIRKTVKVFNRYRKVEDRATVGGSGLRTLNEYGTTETWWLFWIIPIYSRETLT